MSSFYRYLAKRLALIVVTLWLISLVVFSVTMILPGNAADMILGKYATPEKIAALEKQMGLNKPIYIQYIDWLIGFITLDWGNSFVQNNRPVEQIVFRRALRSAQLAAITMTVVTLLAIPLGVIAAVYHNSNLDISITGLSYVGISIPEFVTGTGLLILFAGPVFSIFPSSGYTELSEGVVSWLRHLALPVITMTILLTAHIMRLTRTEVIGTLESEYVRTARLKGLDESTVLIRHALRNGLLPTITLLALDFGYLMGGIVVVEEVFAYPGLGRLVVFSVLERDVPVLQAVVMVIAVVYTFANLGADLLYSYLDPRIEY